MPPTTTILILANVARDTSWDFAVTASDVPWHAPVNGAEGVPRFLAALVENVAIEIFEPRRYIAADADVVVQVHFAFAVKKNGRRVEQDQLHWWTVRDGKVSKLRHFEDTAQVIAAWRS